MVVRARLLESLDEATTRRCTVLSAGPGYGKSILLATWAERQQRFARFAWLTLEPRDADPQRLCGLILAALQRAADGSASGAYAALLRLGPPPAAGTTAVGWVGDVLIPALPDGTDPIVLIMDDIHHLSSSPEALGVVDALIRWAPTSFSMVLAGRSDPPISLQRLRLDGHLSTLRHRDLACTRDETEALLTAWGEDLSEEDVSALHALTEGWPAALRLAALSIGELDTAPEFLERYLARDIALADYLTTEILSGLPQHLRDFVLWATVDDLVCPSLLEAVSGSPDAAGLLAECERRNLLLTRIGGGEDWYAWHAMFAGQMRRRFALEDAGAARHGHLAAARWWREEDFPRAARHALAGGDETLAVAIVAERWIDLALVGESHTLTELVAILPRDADSSAELHLAACYARLPQGDLVEAHAELDRALAARSRLAAADLWRFDARASWVRLYLADRDAELRLAVIDAHRVVDEAPASELSPPSTNYALALLALGMGQARLQEELTDSVRNLRAAAEAGRGAGLPVLEVVAQAELCLPRTLEAGLDDLERDAHEILETATARGWQSLGSMAVPMGVLAWLAFMRGDPETTVVQMEKAREVCSPNDWGLRSTAVYYHAIASLALGDLATAEWDLAEALELTGRGCMPSYAASFFAGLEAEILAARGDLEAALRAVESGPVPEHRLTVCTKARLLRAKGRPAHALRTLEALREAQLPPPVAARADVLRALALTDLGDRVAAHAALEDALAGAEPSGLAWPFLVEGPELAPLLDEHVSLGSVHGAFAVSITERVDAPVVHRAAGRHARLTERELGVLRYLRTAMPNQEIADELFVSVNTVKTHAASIYRKLNVSSRRQAVRRADELGLFGGRMGAPGVRQAPSPHRGAPADHPPTSDPRRV